MHGLVVVVGFYCGRTPPTAWVLPDLTNARADVTGRFVRGPAIDGGPASRDAVTARSDLLEPPSLVGDEVAHPFGALVLGEVRFGVQVA